MLIGKKPLQGPRQPGPQVMRNIIQTRELLLFRYVSVLVLLLSATVYAGIRGPGEYSGIVVEDRWGTVYIYSGVYLMYVSEEAKDLLGDRRGMATVVDASDVFQPMNPGDGLIKQLVVLSHSPTDDESFPVQGIQLRAKANFGEAGVPRFQLLITNTSDERLDLMARDLGITVLAKKSPSNKCNGGGFLCEPSDGSSTAVLTRQSFWGGDEPNTWGRHWELQSGGFRESIEILRPGETKTLTVILQFPPGEYEFLFGYGGGVLDSLSVASNQIAFDIGESGDARVAPGSARGVTPPNNSYKAPGCQ